MGKPIQQRRKEAINTTKKQLEELFPGHKAYYYECMRIVRTSVDNYIANGNVKRCVCGTIISSRNKTGKCRNCYSRQYRKKGEQKRLGALRAKYYRKRKKLKTSNV